MIVIYSRTMSIFRMQLDDIIEMIYFLIGIRNMMNMNKSTIKDLRLLKIILLFHHFWPNSEQNYNLCQIL